MDGAAIVPHHQRSHRRARAHGDRHGVPRRRGHPATRRRDRPRPLLRPGLRARAGPVLGDGLPPPRHRRPGRRAVRGVPGRDRRLRPHAGLARHRRAGVRTARPGLPRLLRGVRARRERLPRHPRRRRPLARVRRARAAEPGVHPRAVDARRLHRVAEGHGVGPQVEPRRRGRPRTPRERAPARGGRPTASPVRMGLDAHDHGRDARGRRSRRRGRRADPRNRRRCRGIRSPRPPPPSPHRWRH